MFEVGLSEVLVIILVACYFLDIKDVPKIIKAVRQVFKYLNSFSKEVKDFIENLEKESKKIVDMEGNEQETFDLDDITPDLEKNDLKTSKTKKKNKNDQQK